MTKHLFSTAFATLCALAFFSSPAAGQTVVNPSFEADTVVPPYGYQPITGWTCGNGCGINTSGMYFADNGAIPDGQKVAFIQTAYTMRQTVPGFTPGLQYRLRYYENRRIATAAANLEVKVGGATVVPTHAVLAVGGSNPYVKTSVVFTASATDMEVAFVVTGGSGEDFTVLLDKVEIGRNLVVLNNNDSGPGSLRQTVIDAPSGSTITFDPAVTGVITQFTGAMGIDKNLTIQGPGAGVLTIRSSRNGIFSVAATVTISGLSMYDARDSAAIVNGGGTLTVSDSSLYSNASGIATYGNTNTTISNCTISNNYTGSGGAGISNYGTMTVTSSTVADNFCSENDGGGGQNGAPFPGGCGINNGGTLELRGGRDHRRRRSPEQRHRHGR
jgi:hypothetical protein